MDDTIKLNESSQAIIELVGPESNKVSREEKLKKILKGRTLEDFIKSHEFSDAVANQSLKTGINPIEIADGFITNVLGTIGDTAITGIDVAETLVDNFLDIAYLTLKGVNTTAANLGRGAVRTVTFNKGTK